MTHEFTKTVAIKAVDEEERTATGAVLVPNEVDRQRDFLTPEGVERMHAADVDDGVMHSAFPEGAAELVRNEVVDESIELNGETYPAGTWVATRKYNDDALWQLVADGVLDGFSIGGEVAEEREYESADALPDAVTFPAEVEPGPATEIVGGSTEEVSDVDIPAVPRATYRELGKLGKGITDEVSGREEFVEVMEGRGHERGDAERLWRFLQREKAVDEPAESGTGQTKSHEMNDTENIEKAEYSTDEFVSWDASGGRARGQIAEVTEDGTFDDAISGDVAVSGDEDEPAYLIEVWSGTGDDASPIEEEAGRGDTMHVAHQEPTLRRADDPREVEASKSGIIASLKSLFGADDASEAEDQGDGADGNAEKAGRTLSQRNRRAVMASVDAQLDLLNDAGVDHGVRRFSDRAEFAFDIEEYGKSEHTAGEDSGEEMDKNAPGGDTPDDDMTDDTENTGKSDAPAWAQSLDEKVEQIDKRVSEMEDGEDAEKSLDDAPEWAQSLDEKVNALAERVDKVSKATAGTQQTGGTEKTGDDTEDLSKTEKQKRELFFGSTGGN